MNSYSVTNIWQDVEYAESMDEHDIEYLSGLTIICRFAGTCYMLVVARLFSVVPSIPIPTPSFFLQTAISYSFFLNFPPLSLLLCKE